MRNIRLEKKLLREKYKNIRMNMTAEFKNECDTKILERLISLYQYRECRYLFTYVSKGLEVDTRRLIEKALADGKKVAVPKCIEQHLLYIYCFSIIFLYIFFEFYSNLLLHFSKFLKN